MSKLGRVARDGLIAGDYPTKSQEITLEGPAVFKRGDVIAQADGGYALVDSAGSGSGTLAVGIVCDDITVEAGESAKTAMYVKGEFNQRSLRFGGTDTAGDHLRRMTEIGLLVRPARV
jgi:hypothetical protein